jgi:hypothetical protein
MKKLITVLLALAMVATMSTTAFAAEIGPGANASQGSTEVSFNVDPTYTVTIPATVELNKVEDNGVITYENDYTLTAQAGVRLKKGEYIEVTVASDFEMTTTEGATLAYSITAGGNAVGTGGVVAEFATNKAEQTATIHIAANDPDYAGEYKDTVTFTIAVKEVAKITFSLWNDVTLNLTAEEGMTWGEWIASEYNELGLTIDGDYITNSLGVRVWDDAIFSNPVITDEIVAGRSYGIYG